jgi:hypothetical protein
LSRCEDGTASCPYQYLTIGASGSNPFSANASKTAHLNNLA